MRVLPLVLAFFPSLVLADEITLTSEITDVTLYPEGARITRSVPFEAPAGRHELRLIDLPDGTPLEYVRVRVEGAEMGAVQMREDYVPPAEARETPEIAAAKAEVARLEEALRAKRDEASAIRAASEAADTRIAFLRQLSQGQALAGADAGQLRELAKMVGEETLAARQAALDAEAGARAMDRAAEEIAEELDRARQALAALGPDESPRNLVAVTIEGEAPAQGRLVLTYYDWRARWAPVYDASLDRDAGKITLRRGALVAQETGENWQDVALTLSTNAPAGAVAPGELWPEKRRIMDPPEVMPLARASGAAMDMAAPMAEPVMVEEKAASANFDGLNVSYNYPDTLDLASSADNLRLALGALTFDAKVQAMAVPKRDKTAFIVAEFTNTSGELILPSAATQLFRDGEFVGSFAQGEAIAAGAEARLAFGPVEGLRLKRLVTRNEGDRGMISKSNEITEKVTLEVENLTGESWPLRVLDQVPYSEQEDLVITWNASPRVSEADVDDKKGVLAWDIEIAPGETQKIELNSSLDWPDGKVLR